MPRCQRILIADQKILWILLHHSHLVIVDWQEVYTTITTASTDVILDVGVIFDHLLVENGGVGTWLLDNWLLTPTVLDVVAAVNHSTLDGAAEIGSVIWPVVVEG